MNSDLAGRSHCVFYVLMGLAALVFSTLAHAETAPSPHLLGKEVQLDAGAERIHDMSRSEWKSIKTQLAKAYSMSSKEKASQAELSGTPPSTIEATTGTWFQGGHSGGWYNTAQSGHGFFVEILPSNNSPTGISVLMAWYAYLNGEQVWILALGPVNLEGNRHKAYLNAWIYDGGDFPPFFNAGTVSERVWGTMTLEFFGCDQAEVSWSTSYPGFSSGSLDLQRLTSLYEVSCNPDLGGSGGGINDDHGNTLQSSTNISNGQQLAGHIETPNDIDVFSTSIIGCSSTASVRAWTTGALDTIGELYRVEGSQEILLNNDDDSGEGLNFLLESLVDCGYRVSIHARSYNGGTGTYTLWLEIINGGGGGTQTIRVDFENQLLRTIQVFLNGVSLGTVPATETRGDSYTVSIGDQFSWSVVQDFGDAMDGVFDPISGSQTSNLLYTVDNIVGTQWYFIPWITNNTATPQLLGVNVELQSENLCNCIIPAYTSNVAAGYFYLWSNGNLRLYPESSGYQGPYTYWENFGSSAQSETGRINFTLNP